MYSMVFYMLIVYPVAYIFVWRMVFQPMIDIINLCFFWTKYLASLYSAFGFVPESVPDDAFFSKKEIKGEAGGFLDGFIDFVSLLRAAGKKK